MKRRVDVRLRAMRIALAVFGAVLLALAVTAALLAWGAVDRIGAFRSAAPVLNATVRRALRDDAGQYQLATLLGGIALVALGLWWLRAQLPPFRHQHDQEFESATPGVGGMNVVPGDALAAALERDLESHTEIRRARAEVHPDDGLVRLRLDVDRRTSVPELTRAVVAPALVRAATVGAIGAVDLQADVRLVEADRPRVT